MGTGNIKPQICDGFLINNEGNPVYEMLYVDKETEDGFDFCEGLEESIIDILDGEGYESHGRPQVTSFGKHRQFTWIYETGFMIVAFVDNDWSIAVVVGPLEKVEGEVLESEVDDRQKREKFYDNLHDEAGEIAGILMDELDSLGYKVSLRTGPWTSQRYEPAKS